MDAHDYPRLVLSERQAADAIGLGHTQLRRLRMDGKGPRAIHLSERRIGYRLCHLEEWVAARPAAI